MRSCQVVYFVVVWINVLADVYLHNPRGSNNRLDENTRQRQNANRLFDSQNNNRGGYNVGGLFYYSGSQLQVEWTNQHSCQSPNNNCEIILQYMCDENHMRDGTVTGTIPLNNEECDGNNCETDLKYGMHENYLYYQHCRSQKRNMGLFTANQKLKGKSALYTRQNPNGNRYAFECPEERDYYPYWRPSPWKDIAVLTNNASKCAYYQNESENVKSRWYCFFPHELLHDMIERGVTIPNTKDECLSFTYPANNPTGKRGEWRETPAHGLPPPECRETEETADNHLGNAPDGQHFGYSWKIPDVDNKICVLRIRYNISTHDFDGWDSSINSSLNKNNVPLSELNPDWLEDIDENNELVQRGYVLQNNPQVQIFSGINFQLQLAINPAQYGRVFEDRSHTFGIVPKPNYIKTSTIHNLNVRGKRGNIVQVYPAVEYDYVPQITEISKGDFIHIQWTGSNNNPPENDGEGLAGSDRSNIVMLMNLLEGQPPRTTGHWGRSYPQQIDQTGGFVGLNSSDLETLAFLQPTLTSGNLDTLDDSGTYFNLGLRKATQVGQFNFMCTRNNNFSNRDQKGRVTVKLASLKTVPIGKNGGTITVGSSKVVVEEGAFQQLIKLEVEEWRSEDVPAAEELKILQSRLKDNLASNVLVIQPENQLSIEGRSIQVNLDINGNSGDAVHVYRTSLNDSSIWQRLDSRVNDGVATFGTERGGVFLARSHKSSSVVTVVIIVVTVVVLIVIGVVIYFTRSKHEWAACKNLGYRTKRSLQSRV